MVPELLNAGHQVVGLARSDASAAALEAAGAEVRRGDLDDVDNLTDAASHADGVIHLAFKHDAVQNGGMNSAIDADAAALRALAQGLEHTVKPILSGFDPYLQLMTRDAGDLVYVRFEQTQVHKKVRVVTNDVARDSLRNIVSIAKIEEEPFL